MITGIHALIYTTDPEGVRAFFRDVLEFPYVDAHEGWLIFTLPPSELGIHPIEVGGKHELTLICDDVAATRANLEAKGVAFTQDLRDDGFGVTTRLRLPDGQDLMLYQPKHVTAPQP